HIRNWCGHTANCAATGIEADNRAPRGLGEPINIMEQGHGSVKTPVGPLHKRAVKLGVKGVSDPMKSQVDEPTELAVIGLEDVRIKGGDPEIDSILFRLV